jgi:hypothetical protein
MDKNTWLVIGITIPLVSGYLALESNSPSYNRVAMDRTLYPSVSEVYRTDTRASVETPRTVAVQPTTVPVVTKTVSIAPTRVQIISEPVPESSPEPVYEVPEPPQAVKPVVARPVQQTLPPLPNVRVSNAISDHWKARGDGQYTLTEAIEDFKNPITGWEASRMHIAGGKLQTTLLKNKVGPDGGLVSWIDIPDSDEYELSFDVMFDDNFDFSQGGKVGFGFLIGDGNTGGNSGSDGNGGSVRLMWYKNTSTSPVIFRPYVYHKDQPTQYGDDFGITYPGSGGITTGTWYTVKMYIKSNTGDNTDGRVKMSINGAPILDKAIRFSTNDAKRLINRVTFETFRGGADASWQSSTDGYIYFNNVEWNSL